MGRHAKNVAMIPPGQSLFLHEPENGLPPGQRLEYYVCNANTDVPLLVRFTRKDNWTILEVATPAKPRPVRPRPTPGLAAAGDPNAPKRPVGRPRKTPDPALDNSRSPASVWQKPRVVVAQNNGSAKE